MKFLWMFLSLLSLQGRMTSCHRDAPEHFSCADGQAILLEKFCDGKEDCVDGTDEKPITSLNETFDQYSEWQRCKNYYNDYNNSCAVQRKRICGGHVTCSGVSPCDLACKTNYRCQNGSCVRRSTICDGSWCGGCAEDHGWHNGVGFKCLRRGRKCVLPQQLVYDDVADCDGLADLCFLHGPSAEGLSFLERIDRRKCFLCLDGATVIAATGLCDGIIDCPDLSDECLCTGQVPSICGRVIKQGQQYDGSNNSVVPSMPRNRSKLPYVECTRGHVMCDDGLCIRREHVCDGYKDCANDESFEYCNGTIMCRDITGYEKLCRCSRRASTSCRNFYATGCDGKYECLHVLVSTFAGGVTSEDECERRCPRRPGVAKPGTFAPIPKKCGDGKEYVPVPFHCKPRTYNSPAIGNDTKEQLVPGQILDGSMRCDGMENCPLGEDEEGCRSRFRCVHGAVKPGFISINATLVCNGIVDCIEGTDESQDLCNETRFECAALDGTLVNIDRKLLCDFIPACDDWSDEKNCTNGRFYCESGDPLFVRESKTFDGRKDCSDWSDECPTINRSVSHDVFSSRYQLIANPFLRVLVWIMGLLSTIGNLAVIIVESRNIQKIGRSSFITVANRALVLNLAASDILMGIYLISLALAGLSLQGSYCAKDRWWRSSNYCISLGLFAAMSSETSVLTLALLAGCRLFSVLKPFAANRHPKTRYMVLLVACAWIPSLLLAFIPLLPSLSSTFVTTAEFLYNPFSRSRELTLDGAKEQYRKLVTYDLRPNVSYEENLDDFLWSSSWGDLEESARRYFVHDYFEIKRRFGYYSAHSVCISKFFASRNDPDWGFSFFINLWNFLAFFFVAASYVAIQIIASKRSAMRSGCRASGDKDEIDLQRRILRLIMTDFCCWMPICLMAFSKLAGARIGGSAYAVAAIVLLPINSALNPLLYSDFLGLLCRRTSVYMKCRKRNVETTVTTSQVTAMSIVNHSRDHATKSQ